MDIVYCNVVSQVFSSEAAFAATSECLQIMGGLGYMKNHPHERHMRDARVLSIYEVRSSVALLVDDCWCVVWNIRLFLVLSSVLQNMMTYKGILSIHVE